LKEVGFDWGLVWFSLFLLVILRRGLLPSGVLRTCLIYSLERKSEPAGVKHLTSEPRRL
jgi:hypothetical protein